MAGLTAAPCSADTRLLQGFGIREFRHTLDNGMPVTAEEARNITEAAASQFAGFNRGIPTPIFFREALVKHTHLRFDCRTIVWHPCGSHPVQRR